MNSHPQRTTQILHAGNEALELLPEKAIWWAKKQTLILSDLHLGKAGHFRKSGLAAPGQINRDNLIRLSELLSLLPASRLLVLGDLFHSTLNREWDAFVAWRRNYPDLRVQLVAGNHDLLPMPLYCDADIETFTTLREGAFSFLHEAHPSTRPQEQNQAGAAHPSTRPQEPNSPPFILSGHVHPGVKIRGKGRQTLRLPCFFMRQNGILLPAFGTFTGLHILKPAPDDIVYAIAEQTVIPIRHSL